MSDDLKSMKVSELKILAKEKGVPKYYKMSKAELLRELAEKVVEEVVEAAEEVVEEVVEVVEEAVEDIVEEVVEAAEEVAEAVEEAAEKVTDDDEDEVRSLYPQVGDIIELEDGHREMVLSAKIVPRGEGFGIDVRYTDGTMLVINDRKRQKEAVKISGGLIDFWPPTGARVLRDGVQILPSLPEEKKWYQFWKWFR